MLKCLEPQLGLKGKFLEASALLYMVETVVSLRLHAGYKLQVQVNKSKTLSFRLIPHTISHALVLIAMSSIHWPKVSFAAVLEIG